nr:EOG090X0296 [Lepidurus arcticus]
MTDPGAEQRNGIHEKKRDSTSSAGKHASKGNGVSNGEHRSEKSSPSHKKHKHKSSEKDRDKDRDRHKDKDKERSKEKSHKDKKHKSSEKDRDRDRHKEKSKSKDHDRKKSEEKHKIKVEPKRELDSEDDVPLSTSKRNAISDDEDDDRPLSTRKTVKEEVVPKDEKKSVKQEKPVKGTPLKKEVKEKSNKRKVDDEDDFKPAAKKAKKSEDRKDNAKGGTGTRKGKAKKEDEEETWRWWEEEKHADGVKWKTLVHKGPVFAPDYVPLPKHVKFHYNGKHMQLSQDSEEIATFYGKMLDHDYTTKEIFNKNFFKDWRKTMTSTERETITDLKKCDFSEMNTYFKEQSEQKKNMTKEEKLKIKQENEEIVKEYGWCIIDDHKQRIGNFKIEPPGLFRGRGDHPKMGMVKRRVMPRDVIINCSKGEHVPKPPAGHKWKEVRYDNHVTWLASWTENVQGQVKYVMLNSASRLKGEKDWGKYEVARQLNSSVETIRENYRQDWKSKEMRIRQRAVALYFIDKLALRAGNEKDEDQADTVGCCSLRVEHIQLLEEKDGKECVVVFDFPGKDSIRYYNEVPVEKRVFKNLQIFMENKQPGDDLFDRLNTAILNKHLNDLMEGLTAKVFRTFNASNTLQEQLDKLTDPNSSVQEKILTYNRANRAVAILCNHQRAIPKTFAKSMENLQKKIDDKKEQINEAKRSLKDAQKEAKRSGAATAKATAQKKAKAIERLEEQMQKLELQATDRDENKEIALGTSKLNYLDPRISIAWCKKFNVPIEKIYNKTQREKFQWAIDMAGADYRF